VDQEANRAGRVEEARVRGKEGVGVNSEHSGKVEGVKASQLGAREKSCETGVDRRDRFEPTVRSQPIGRIRMARRRNSVSSSALEMRS
jgi:hypothetical protein